MLSPAGSAAPALAASRKALSAERQRLRFGYASGCLYFPHVQPELPAPPVKPERPADAATPGARINDRIESRSARRKAREPPRQIARPATAETPGARIEQRIGFRSARSKARAPPPKVTRPASAETPGARIEQRIESRARQPTPSSPLQQPRPHSATVRASSASRSVGLNGCTLAAAASAAVPFEVPPVPGKAVSASSGPRRAPQQQFVRALRGLNALYKQASTQQPGLGEQPGQRRLEPHVPSHVPSGVEPPSAWRSFVGEAEGEGEAEAVGEAEGEGEGEGEGGGGSEAEAWTAAAELAKLGSLTLLASHRSDWRGGEGTESRQAAKQGLEVMEGMEVGTEDSAVGSGSGTGAAEAEAAIALHQAIKTAVAAICRGASEDQVRRGAIGVGEEVPTPIDTVFSAS